MEINCDDTSFYGNGESIAEATKTLFYNLTVYNYINSDLAVIFLREAKLFFQKEKSMTDLTHESLKTEAFKNPGSKKCCNKCAWEALKQLPK